MLNAILDILYELDTSIVVVLIRVSVSDLCSRRAGHAYTLMTFHKHSGNIGLVVFSDIFLILVILYR